MDNYAPASDPADHDPGDEDRTVETERVRCALLSDWSIERALEYGKRVGYVYTSEDFNGQEMRIHAESVMWLELDRSRYQYRGPNGAQRDRRDYSPEKDLRVTLADLMKVKER